MELIYTSVLKRVRFSAGDSQRVAELREILQKTSARRLTDSDVIRKAVTIALGVLQGTTGSELGRNLPTTKAAQ